MTAKVKNESEKFRSIKAKVEKLLRQAADREGTPEGDAFREKAFSLMAEYGVEESQLEEQSELNVIRFTIDLDGTYTDMQYQLVNVLAGVLHCEVVMYKKYNSTKVTKVIVFGRPHHVNRVHMLHTILVMHMIAGATNALEPAVNSATSVQTRKRSWMRGFIQAVGIRLKNIEAAHAEEFVSGNHSGEVALMEDRKLAQMAAAEDFPNLRFIRNRGPKSFDPTSFAAGSAAGQQMDLGQSRMKPGYRELR